MSAALLDAEIERSLGLRPLPPARFLEPVALSLRTARAARLPRTPPRPGRSLGRFAALLALTSIGLAGWNTYWLVDSTGIDITGALRALLG